MIKAIILDCDGVILDSNKAYELMYEELFERYGVHKSPKEIYAFFGDSPMHILHKIFPNKDIRPIFRDYKKHLKDSRFNKMIKIHPGAKASIWKMSGEYTVVVASGALRFRLMNSLKKHGLMKYIKFAIGSDQVKHAKPHPEALLKIMKRLGVGKKEVIFVGDAPNDLRAAKRAGVKFIAVLSGVFDKETAMKMHANYIVRDINKVRKIVDHLNKRD